MSLPAALAAVTGVGCVCAAGASLGAVLDNLDASPPKPALPSRFTDVPCVHPVFEAYAPLHNLAHDDLFHAPGLNLLLASTHEALSDAGFGLEDMAGKRVGVCLGSSVGFAINYFPLYKAWRQGEQISGELLKSLRHSNYALALQRRLGLVGPCQLVANACASGTDAIGIGASWIASGLCDMVLAGGAEGLSFISYQGFIKLMISDTSPCRPFDRRRNGLNLGEGAAVMLLEAANTARPKRGHILGYATASDAYHPTAPHPEGRGLRRALKGALRQAGVSAHDVGFVNVHGTATRDNDKVESLVLREELPGVPVLATKGATGHTLGAAGAIEAAISLGCLQRRLIPASPGFREADPELGLSPTTQPMHLERRIAVSDSLAFGGCNSVLVLGAGQP